MRRLTRARFTSTALAVGVVLLGGCLENEPVRTGADRIEPKVEQNRPVGAPVRTRVSYAVRVYTLTVPRNAISYNRELWRRIDEGVIDLSTYDVLYANGIRVGAAPQSELQHVADQLNDPATPSETVMGREAEGFEIPVKKNQPEQTLFWFDRAKQAQGRTFGAGDQLMYLHFAQTPREPDKIRLGLSPVVRESKKELRFTPFGNDYEVGYEQPTTVWDLSMQVDLPLDHFLIVAPSPESQWDTSLGRAFFTDQQGGRWLERVLVLVPFKMEYREELEPAAPN